MDKLPILSTSKKLQRYDFQYFIIKLLLDFHYINLNFYNVINSNFLYIFGYITSSSTNTNQKRLLHQNRKSITKKTKQEPTKFLSNKKLQLENMVGALPQDYIYGWSTKDQLQNFMNDKGIAVKCYKNKHGKNSYPSDGISRLPYLSFLQFNLITFNH